MKSQKIVPIHHSGKGVVRCMEGLCHFGGVFLVACFGGVFGCLGGCVSWWRVFGGGAWW